MLFPRTRPTLLALSIVAALHATSALAAPVTPASVALTSRADTLLSGNIGQDVQGPNATGTFAGSSQADTTGSVAASSFARPSGAYAVNTFAEGGAPSGASASAESTLQYVLSNTGAVSQHYFLTLKIYGGTLNLQVQDPAGLVAGESLSSAYRASVGLLGAPGLLFDSQAQLVRSGNDIDLTRSGTVLSGANDEASAESNGFYAWSTDFYELDLGVVAAGDSITVLADLQGASFANVGTYAFGQAGCGGGGYGDALVAPAAGQDCFKARARLFYGDPLGGQDGDAFAFSAADAVPVPATPLLAGGALMALALTGRRRRPRSGGG